MKMKVAKKKMYQFVAVAILMSSAFSAFATSYVMKSSNDNPSELAAVTETQPENAAFMTKTALADVTPPQPGGSDRSCRESMQRSGIY